jgi:hypothetical protein
MGSECPPGLSSGERDGIDSMTFIGEYVLGNTRIWIMRLGDPELHECGECWFVGTPAQMLDHVKSHVAHEVIL